MADFLRLLAHVLAAPFKSQARLEAEIVVLRHQLNVLRRGAPAKPRLTAGDRLMFVWLLRVFPSIRSAIQIVQARWFADVAQRAPGLHVLTVLPLRWGPTLIFILVVGFLFYFVPNTPVRFRDVWIGAVLTGLLWRIVLEGFSLYLRDMSRFKVVHGSIAAVVVFLVWVYTSAVVFLYGVEFTAAYAHLRREARTDQGSGSGA